jgi:hypothetical protein
MIPFLGWLTVVILKLYYQAQHVMGHIGVAYLRMTAMETFEQRQMLMVLLQLIPMMPSIG